jgi:hypothetical protein
MTRIAKVSFWGIGVILLALMLSLAFSNSKAYYPTMVGDDPYPPPTPEDTPSAPTYPFYLYLPVTLNSRPLFVSESYYLQTVDPYTLYLLGRDAGFETYMSGRQDSVVVLHFGQPWEQSSGGGTEYGVRIFNEYNDFRTINQVEAAAREFANGYWETFDGISSLNIAISTSNYGEYSYMISNQHGREWAKMSNRLNSYLCSTGTPYMCYYIAASGASNMEVQWNGPWDTQNWVNGFLVENQWQVPLIAINNATGCRNWYVGAGDYYNCYANWAMINVWEVSWRGGVIRPLPMIYDTGGFMADDWYKVSLYAYYKDSSYEPADIEGVMTQDAACQANPTDPGCIGGWTTPEQGYNDLYGALGSDSRTAQGIRWLTDMQGYFGD